MFLIVSYVISFIFFKVVILTNFSNKFFNILLCFLYLAPPKFLKKTDEELILPVGKSTAIEIPFSSNPMPRITWTFNKTSKPDSRRIKEETIHGMTSLTMAKVIRKDAGPYKVTLENDFGKAELTIKLIVQGM